MISMRVLVTGHLGYIGSVLVPVLQAAGHDVVGLDTDLYRGCTFGDPTGCRRSRRSTPTCATSRWSSSTGSTRSCTWPRCRTIPWATSTRA